MLRSVAIVLALGCSLGLCAAACGGGGSASTSGPTLTLQEYFRQLDEADNIGAARFSQIGKQLSQKQSEAEGLATIKVVYPEEVVTLKDLAGSMEKLRPPSEVKGAHDAAVAALRHSVEVTQKNSEAIQRATAFNQVTDLLSAKETSDASQKTSDTCKALQKAGTDRGIAISLDC